MNISTNVHIGKAKRPKIKAWKKKQIRKKKEAKA